MARDDSVRGAKPRSPKPKSRPQANLQKRGPAREKRNSTDAILQAAIAEFSRRGFDGARMEAIAEGAGYNKSLVYRRFTNKQGLFEAALRYAVQQRTALAQRMPDELTAILKYWFQQSLRDPDYLRLLIREALQDTGDEIVEEDARRAYYREHTALIKRFQDAGWIRDEYDPAYLNLAMTALTMFPAVFPQLTRLITGCSAASTSFVRNWNRLLDQFASAKELYTDGENTLKEQSHE